ncbi:SDR family NAD(P)-dependent oxidoreductase [Aquimarina sp. D1M17]|uniref:SDR family NAD(P)-dependent oxidoreductase n=1 Tax=Aquimarina acroporae TaxID=2937283 RepID=UPI0020BEDF18|nr:SDR family NAD(P)-dependent oxidoreductase [Aquimarina acroporae]MCK8520094.1 SDR family NAD(P)-dependent oxidoreductase [Aquimarina acroporae]
MSHKHMIWCDARTLSKNITGKVYIVTGANSGVGLETTRQLIKQGGHVVMACRRIEAAQKEAKSFIHLEGSYEIMKCDLANLESVREFALSFLQKYNRLDGLMCNAGMVVMDNKQKFTDDGFELTFGVNFLGHFFLTELLLECLKQTEGARMGILSSVVHAGSTKNRYKVHLDDLNFERRKYSNFAAYGEAKVASVLYAKELSERLQNYDVFTASIHPGWARSNFGSGGNFFMRALMTIAKPFTRGISNSNWESAQTSLHVLLSDNAIHHSGDYFSQHSVLYSDKECKKGGWPMKSPNPNANDMVEAWKLVEKSYELVGLK